MTYSEELDRKREIVKLALYQIMCLDALGNFTGIENTVDATGEFYCNMVRLAEPVLKTFGSDNALASEALFLLKEGKAHELFVTTIKLSKVIDDIKQDLKDKLGDINANLIEDNYGRESNMKLVDGSPYNAVSEIVNAVRTNDNKMINAWKILMASMNEALIDDCAANGNLVMHCCNQLKEQVCAMEKKYDWDGLGIASELIELCEKSMTKFQEKTGKQLDGKLTEQNQEEVDNANNILIDALSRPKNVDRMFNEVCSNTGLDPWDTFGDFVAGKQHIYN